MGLENEYEKDESDPGLKGTFGNVGRGQGLRG